MVKAGLIDLDPMISELNELHESRDMSGGLVPFCLKVWSSAFRALAGDCSLQSFLLPSNISAERARSVYLG